MSCGCNDSGMINSWIDWAKTSPQNPQDIIANATLNGIQGTYLDSSNYATPPGANVWIASPISLSTTFNPLVTALGTDNLLNVADATDWTFSHVTANTSTKVALPLRKVIFLRGGRGWLNTVKLDFGGLSYSDVQLSFRDNAGTRGDQAGTIPVISWTVGPFTGATNLALTLNTIGRAIMGIRLISAAGDYSMYESEWIIVP